MAFKYKLMAHIPGRLNNHHIYAIFKEQKLKKLNSLTNAIAKEAGHTDTGTSWETIGGPYALGYFIAKRAWMVRWILDYRIRELSESQNYHFGNRFIVGGLEVAIPNSLDAQRKRLDGSDGETTKDEQLEIPLQQPLSVAIKLREASVVVTFPPLDDQRDRWGVEGYLCPDVVISQLNLPSRNTFTRETIGAAVGYIRVTEYKPAHHNYNVHECVLTVP